MSKRRVVVTGLGIISPVGSSVRSAWEAVVRGEHHYMTVARLAEKHQLGLFNASSSGEEVWVPKDGRMALAHDKGPPGIVGRIMELLNLSK